jgi:uncharacterized SAM-dependent methyltransferase
MVFPLLRMRSEVDIPKRGRLRDSLRSKCVDIALLYESPTQSALWKKLHEQFSPIHSEKGFEIYETFFSSVVSSYLSDSRELRILSLGCGSGAKDALLFKKLPTALLPGISYFPLDVSPALAQNAAGIIDKSFPAVIIRPHAGALNHAVSNDFEFNTSTNTQDLQRWILFLGMLPGMTYREASEFLKRLLHEDECVLISANTIPGNETESEMQAILEQYDNPLTSDWLLQFWRELGVESQGILEFQMGRDPDRADLPRIEARFRFLEKTLIEVEGERFNFSKGEEILTFFSTRYSPAVLREFADNLGLSQIIQIDHPGESLLAGTMGPSRSRLSL